MRAARVIVVFATAAPAVIGVTVHVSAGDGPAAGSARAELAFACTVSQPAGASETARLAAARAEARVAQGDDTPATLPSPQGPGGDSTSTALAVLTGSAAPTATAQLTARAPPAVG